MYVVARVQQKRGCGFQASIDYGLLTYEAVEPRQHIWMNVLNIQGNSNRNFNKSIVSSSHVLFQSLKNEVKP
jgi:hypothetical protein